MADDLRSSLLGAGDAGEDAGSSGEGRHESSGALAAAQTRSQTDWGPADRRLSRGSTLPNEGGARIGDGPERDGLQGDGEWRLGTIGRYSSNRATLRQHSLSESIMSDQMSSMSLAEHEYLVDSQTAREGCLRATETRTSQTFLCIAVALISGTYLSFGIYAERLKLTGDFTQVCQPLEYFDWQKKKKKASCSCFPWVILVLALNPVPCRLLTKSAAGSVVMVGFSRKWRLLGICWTLASLVFGRYWGCSSIQSGHARRSGSAVLLEGPDI